MPEVDIKPFATISPHSDDPFNPTPKNEITNYVHKGNFALRAKNLSAKEFLDILCFLSDRKYSLTNNILSVEECCENELTTDNGLSASILKLAKEIIIPEVTFRLPANIVDAVDFFYQATEDYDDPEKPKNVRGINFAVKSPGEIKLIEEDVPKISGHGGFQSVLDAIKYVCHKSNSGFIVYGKTIVFVPKTDQMKDKK